VSSERHVLDVSQLNMTTILFCKLVQVLQVFNLNIGPQRSAEKLLKSAKVENFTC